MESVGNINPNQHTIQEVVAALKAQLSDINGIGHIFITKSELDSHANMIVLGKDCFIFETTGKNVMFNLLVLNLVLLQIYQL